VGQRGSVKAGDCNFSCTKVNEKHQLGGGILYTTEEYQQLRKSLLARGYHIE
jgi:hypothetical protein